MFNYNYSCTKCRSLKSGLIFQDAFEFFSNLTDQLDEILKVSCVFWGAFQEILKR